MWKHVLATAAASLASLALGCGSVDSTDHPDADPTVPDADPTAPDADPTIPDADPTAPDADPTAPDAAPPGPTCGGPTGALCASDEYCEYMPDSCGLSGEIGACTDRPMVCPDVVLPVCGCNHVTYGNVCEAHAAGQDVLYDGDCATMFCGGFTGAVCDPGYWCDYNPNTCGFADGSGDCRPSPMGCPDIYDPVCGCNGVTYSNECDANAAGQDIQYYGMCT